MSPKQLNSIEASLKRARSDDDDGSVQDAPDAPRWGVAKKIKTSLLGDDENVDSYDEPHDNFVLCGRGEGTNRHPGNRAFRRVVKANRSLYHSGPRQHKTLIARSIVEAVYRQDPPGRFVRKQKSGLWVDIGKDEAVRKTKQALREESLKEKNKSDVEESKSDDDNEENESTGTGKEDEGDDQKPSAEEAPHPGNMYAHEQGFAEGTVSYHSSERGENDDTVARDDDFDRLIDNLDLLAHDADFEQDQGILSRHSSEGSNDFPLPVCFSHHSSIDSGLLSVVSTDSTAEVSNRLFDEDLFLNHMIDVQAV